MSIEIMELKPGVVGMLKDFPGSGDCSFGLVVGPGAWTKFALKEDPTLPDARHPDHYYMARVLGTRIRTNNLKAKLMWEPNNQAIQHWTYNHISHIDFMSIRTLRWLIHGSMKIGVRDGRYLNEVLFELEALSRVGNKVSLDDNNLFKSYVGFFTKLLAADGLRMPSL